MSELAYQDEHIEVFFQDGDQEICLITFAPATMRANGLRFWASELALKLGIASIGFVAKRSNWFPLLSVAKAREAVDSRLGGFKHVISYGSSMGGYGALKYGKLFGAAYGISFAPQISISPLDVDFDGRFFVDYRIELHRGMKIGQDDLPKSSYVFFDPFHEMDHKHALEIAALSSSVELVPCVSTGHETVSAFAGREKIGSVLQAVLRESPDDVRALARAASKSSKVRPKIVAERVGRRRPRLAIRIFEKYKQNYNSRQGAIFFHTISNSLRSPLDAEFARELSLRAIRLCPSVGDFYMRISEICENEGDNDRAEEWARVAVKVDPAGARLHHHLAKIFIKQDRLGDAAEASMLAVRLAQNNPVFILRQSDIEDRRGNLEAALSLAEVAVTLAPRDVNVCQHAAKLRRKVVQVRAELTVREAASG